MDSKNLHLFNETDIVAWVGAGGKSSLIFSLAKIFFSRCVISTSTHMADFQRKWADNFSEINKIEQIEKINFKKIQGTYLLTEHVNDIESGKLPGLRQEFMDLLIYKCKYNRIPLFIEADGSKNRPIKTPGLHEPAIPQNVNKVCVVAGLSGLGKSINSNSVHRPELAANILNKSQSDIITIDDYYNLLTSEKGGLKSIPEGADRYLFLNQSDLLENLESIYELAFRCKPYFNHVLITYYDNKSKSIKFVADFGQVGCILLAAGESKRFRTPKQLAKWHSHTFLETTINNISSTTLKPITVVTGAYHELLSPILSQFTNIINIYNPGWKKGQSGSVRIGIESLNENIEAVIFLLVDQPQINPEMLNRIVVEYARTKSDIIGYEYKGKIRHPVLFSRNTFNDLLSIQGDSGGRQLFKKYSPLAIPINNSFFAMDFDTPEELANFLKTYNINN